MNDHALMSASHAVHSLRLHIVFVTKYRRHTLTPELLDALRDAFTAILADWRCALIEFGGEADPVHLLVGIHPALNISILINTLKSATARRMRNRFVGEAPLETVKRYVETQGTKEKPRKAAKRPPPVT